MKTKFLQRVLWLVIPLLTLLPNRAWAVDYEYQMITAASQMTAGTYVVGALRSTSATNNFYFGKATVSSGDWVVSDTYVTVAAVNGVRKFDATSLPTGAVEFTFTGDKDNGFTIKNGSNYLYFTANSNRKLAFASSGSTYKWKVADKSSPLITGGVYLSYASGTYTIYENSTATGAIRGYAGTTAYRAIYLFKKQEKAGGSTCATPTFSVAAGTYTSSQSVTLSCTTTGATIHYTTDGTTPTNSSPTYSSAITVDVTKTIKAIAIKDGMTNSEVASATYTIKCATPTFSPGAGTYGAAQSVSISTTYGTNIYYTTDGTTPTTSSTPYTSAISVSSTQTIKAIASKSGCSDSDEGSAAYTINIPYTVSFSTGTGNPQQADIPETVAGAGITLPDGPTPACSGDGWSFAGWGYESCDETSDEPYLYFPGNTYYPEDDETLYAVYVQDETPTTTYMLLSEGAQVAPDANYIITAFAVDKAIKSEVYKSYYIEAADVTVEETETDYHITSPNNQLIWRMGKNGSTISLYNATDENYLKIYETNGHHNLALDASEHTFTLSEVRDPGYVSKFKMESTNDPGYYVLYSTGSTDFTATNNANEDTELYLYKQMNSGTYNSNPVCCDKNVTLAHNSPLNGKVTFSSAGPIETCDGTVNTTMTITPNTGYYLSDFNWSTGAGTITPGVSPAISTSSATGAQVITLSYGKEVSGTSTANATFTAKDVTDWTWKQKLVDNSEITIPNPVDLYIGQEAWFDLKNYIPNDVIAQKKGYNASYDNNDLAQGGKGDTRYKIRAKVAKESMSLTLTSTSNESVTVSITIRGTALPSVTFVDNIHNKTDFTVGEETLPASGVWSATVDGTDKRIVYLTQKTPKHDDIPVPATGNDCEKSHLHLVGWIYSEWSGVVDYLDGSGSKPDKTALEAATVGTAEGFPADTPCFFAPNTDINTVTWNGKTFYAVWAKEAKEAE